jgi:hypothetical protein
MSCEAGEVLLSLAGGVIFVLLARLGWSKAEDSWVTKGRGMQRKEDEREHSAAVERVKRELEERDKVILKRAEDEKRTIESDIAEELAKPTPTREDARKDLDDPTRKNDR